MQSRIRGYRERITPYYLEMIANILKDVRCFYMIMCQGFDE